MDFLIPHNPQKAGFFLICGILFTSVVFTSVSAQQDTAMIMDPIQADRPDLTESASLVPKGWLQMEYGFSIENTEPGFIYTYPSALLKYGFTDNFEFRFIAEYIHIQKSPDPIQRGFLPLAVGIKTKMASQKGILPQMAFLGHLSLPGLEAEKFRTTYIIPDLRLAFQHAITNSFSVSYNVGLEWDGETTEPNVIYSLATGLGFGRLGIYGEIYGSTPQREAGEIELRADAGMTFLVGNDFLFDVSAGKGISEMASGKYIAIGFSYRFKM
jgi:hypothetical protein